MRKTTASLAALALVLTGCSSSAAGESDETTDLLTEILDRGAIVISTDPAYPPQSSFDDATGEWVGFDIDVATEIAERLGVEIQWETPAWDVITAGRWNDRWDLSVGSMAVTSERLNVLEFSDPYYYATASIAVAADSPIQSVDELAGKSIGVCSGCTYEAFLRRTLEVPGYEIEYTAPEDVDVRTYDSDLTAIQDLEIGRIDAVIAATSMLDQAAAESSSIRVLPDPVLFEPQVIAADLASSRDSSSLITRVNEILEEMRNDGTLSALSETHFGRDLTQSEEPAA